MTQKAAIYYIMETEKLHSRLECENGVKVVFGRICGDNLSVGVDQNRPVSAVEPVGVYDGACRIAGGMVLRRAFERIKAYNFVEEVLGAVEIYADNAQVGQRKAAFPCAVYVCSLSRFGVGRIPEIHKNVVPAAECVAHGAVGFDSRKGWRSVALADAAFDSGVAAGEKEESDKKGGYEKCLFHRYAFLSQWLFIQVKA